MTDVSRQRPKPDPHLTFAQAKKQVVTLDLHQTDDSYLNIEGYIFGIKQLLGCMEIELNMLYGEQILAEGERRGGKMSR